MAETNQSSTTKQDEKTKTETYNESINVKYCDIYELYNAIQFAWIGKLFIDTRSTVNFQKQTIFHAINLSSVNINDKIDVLSRYKNVLKIYILLQNNVSLDELNVEFFKHLISILEQCNMEDDKNEDQQSDDEDDWLTFVEDETQTHEEETKYSDDIDFHKDNTINVAKDIEIKVLKEGFSTFYEMFPYLCYSPETTNGDHFIEYPNHIINNRLYLGNINHSRSESILKTLKITHILNMSEKLNAFEQDDELQIKYLQCSLKDTANEEISKYFNKGCTFINNVLNKDKNNRILVHCSAGISRSSAMIIAYLMKTKKMKYEEAYQYVLERRDIIQPNSGFIKQLQLFSANGCQ